MSCTVVYPAVMVTLCRLTAGAGFTESTRDKVCTQYSSRDCTRY